MSAEPCSERARAREVGEVYRALIVLGLFLVRVARQEVDDRRSAKEFTQVRVRDAALVIVPPGTVHVEPVDVHAVLGRVLHILEVVYLEHSELKREGVDGQHVLPRV